MIGPARVKVVSDENAGRIARKQSISTGPQRVAIATTKNALVAAGRKPLGDVTSNAQRVRAVSWGLSSDMCQFALADALIGHRLGREPRWWLQGEACAY